MAGRPFAQEKYDKFLKMIGSAPRSVRDVANKLKIGERTVYGWLKRARDEGYTVARSGFNPSRWRLLP